MTAEIKENWFLKLCGIGVHTLTALGLICGLLTIFAIVQQQYILAFTIMGLALVIDAVDGTLARRFHVRTTWPNYDGALLDNITDFVNYVFTPCVFIIAHPNIMPHPYDLIFSCAILLASAYQFCQSDAKTKDCFFKGFPSYWNFVAFYMFSFQTSAFTNAIATTILLILVFVPIKYIYLSRMNAVSHHRSIRFGIMALSLLFGALNLWMLFGYPDYPAFCFYGVIGYLVFYFGLSLYRTFFPLKPATLG